MTTKAHKLRELRRIGARLAENDALYERRLVLFQELTGDGASHAEIAEAAGCTPGAVAFALHKARRRAAPQPSPKRKR